MPEKNKKLPGRHHLHDAFFQKMMSEPKVARDFFKAHLPKKLLERIDLRRLALQPRIHIDDVGSSYIADLVCKTVIDEKDAYLYLAVEHQSYNDPMLAFRILKYIVHIMDKHLKESEKNHLPLVYPCVVYHGKGPCRLQPDIRKLVDAPSELIDAYFLKPFKLIDLTQIDDQELAKHQWAGLMELALKAAYLSDSLPTVEMIINLYPTCGDDVGIMHVVLEYTVRSSGVASIPEFLQMVNQQLPSEVGESIMTIAEQLRQEGHQEGHQKGVETMAEHLLRAGVDPRLVARASSLSVKAGKEITEPLLSES